MIDATTFPMANFVKKFFRATYGVEDDELYHNIELRDRIRAAVKNLRSSYRNSFCTTNYNDDEIRKAYMIAYYPYYIVPANYVVKNFIAPCISPREIIQADFFASGPCPELLGTVSALKETERCIRVKVQTYDSVPAWFLYQQITFDFAERILQIFRPAVMTEQAGELIETDIFFLQNFLSHLPWQCGDDFLNKFSTIVKSSKQGIFFVFIDLNYDSVRMVFRKLVDENFLQTNGLAKIAAHIPDDGDPLTIYYNDTTENLRKNIFTGEDGLKQKKNTNFYFVVLQKI